MAETTARRDAVAADEQILARFEHMDIGCQPNGALVLLAPSNRRSRVVAGALVELGKGLPGGSTKVMRLQAAGDGGERVETTQVRDEHGDGVQLRRTFVPGGSGLSAEWTMTAYKHSRLLRIALLVRNERAEPIVVRRLFPFVAGVWWGRDTLRVGGREQGFSVYKNGWQSWSFAGGLPLGRADPRPRVPTNVAWHSPGGVNPSQPGGGLVDVVSEEMGMLGHAGEPEALLAGFLCADRWLGQVYAQRREGAFAAAALLDDYALPPGEVVSVPPLVVGLGPQDELVREYAAAVAQEGRARPVASMPAGWCSWYYYFAGVTEADVLENLAQARALRAALPFDIMQVDDGYQTAIGDWLSVNEKFPRGMRFLADRIREAGFRPGIWLAPFTVAANSRLAREHPDWLIHDDRGQTVFGGHNWDTDLYGLDTSHPSAREWLGRLFRIIVNEWGFDYLKLDFLVSGA
ncbi:MAG TPA: glycoside hydrolase family 36 protein, partial [Ktedonobacterales bacterium]|nr:glycoside hydrolase family 36 protein [Ktedonobacterales bacterium]